MIVVIAGPTASGKTEIATKLAQHFNGYIINADSRQVLQELNIGTAKPTTEEMEKSKVNHELFGHISIDEEYNLHRYQKEVFDILRKNPSAPAFLVGGTGLYIDSVVYNYELKDSKKNDRKDYSHLSLEKLQEKVGENLNKLNESDRQNPHRLIRFLEKDFQIYKKGKPLNHLYLVIDVDFETLEKRIRERINTMFADGLLEENQELFRKGKKINTIGYREFQDFFEKKIDLEETKERIYVNTRKYAKRQITWFKRNENAIWVKNYDQALNICQNFLPS